MIDDKGASYLRAKKSQKKVRGHHIEAQAVVNLYMFGRLGIFNDLPSWTLDATISK